METHPVMVEAKISKHKSIFEYMDEWEKFNETTLPEKEEFYSNLNMEDITDADYIHAKRVCKDIEIKHLGEYHDLYLKSDTLLLVDVFKNFRKKSLKISHLDPVKFPSAHANRRCAKTNNKYTNDYDKNKESSYLKYWEVNNTYGCTMLQKLPVNNFEWIEDISQFNEDFIKPYGEESDEGYFLEVDIQNQKLKVSIKSLISF